MVDKKYVNIDLNTFAAGELAEDIQAELEKVANNIQDLNTEAKVKRKLIIEIEFLPIDDSRKNIPTKARVKSTLAPRRQSETIVLSGRNINTGFAEMNELTSGIPGQTQLDPDDGKLKTDIGEEIDNDGNIIDFNKRQISK